MSEQDKQFAEAVTRWRTTDERDVQIAELEAENARLRAERDAFAAALEREQCDEALLRQALEALEQIATELPWELTGLQADTIAGMGQKA